MASWYCLFSFSVPPAYPISIPTCKQSAGFSAHTHTHAHSYVNDLMPLRPTNVYSRWFLSPHSPRILLLKWFSMFSLWNELRPLFSTLIYSSVNTHTHGGRFGTYSHQLARMQAYGCGHSRALIRTTKRLAGFRVKIVSMWANRKNPPEWDLWWKSL